MLLAFAEHNQYNGCVRRWEPFLIGATQRQSQPPSRPSKGGFSFYLLSGALGSAAAGALEAAGSGSLLTPEESGISRQSSE
jgi:hypothetical protein